MAKQRTNINFSLKPLAGFLKKFHIIIFFVVVSIGLMVALLIIVSILNLSTSIATTTDEKINGTFDQTTIKRIEGLDTRKPSRPGNRPSPFVEP